MTHEWVQVKSTLHALSNPRFECSKCLFKYSDRRDHAEMTEKVRKTMFCRELSPEPVHQIDETLAFKTCIGNYYSPTVVSWLQAHNHFETGTMPFPGSLLDQPNKVIELFGVFEEHKIERRREHKRKVEEEQRRRAGGR